MVPDEYIAILAPSEQEKIEPFLTPIEGSIAYNEFNDQGW